MIEVYFLRHTVRIFLEDMWFINVPFSSIVLHENMKTDIQQDTGTSFWNNVPSETSDFLITKWIVNTLTDFG